MADDSLATLEPVAAPRRTIDDRTHAQRLRALRSRVETTLGRSVFGHPLYVWALWAIAAAILAACPMMLSDPAMWFYVTDPELLALIVIIGVRYTRLELAVVSLQIRANVRACVTRWRGRRV